MKTLIVFSILMLFSLVLAAQQPATQIPSQPQARQTTDPYRLTPGDVVEIRFYFNPELNEQVQIRPDGRISLQLIGEAMVAGLTVEEAKTMLEQVALKEIATPRVTIQVRTFAGLKVFVTGEVVRPGPIGLPGAMTLVEAIAEAGGRTVTADGKIVILIRKTDAGQPEGRRLSPYMGDKEGPDAAFLLRPYDVIMVPETKITKLDRWVDQHIKQLSPVMLSAGFTYLIQKNPNNTGGITVPIF